LKIVNHIDTAIIPGPAGASYSPMYLMHKYWSKKPSEIISRYIDTYTKVGDIVLDPFGGYGVTAFEAIKLGRRAVVVDLNPMATFIERVIFEPVNLSHLRWAFQDIKEFCESKIFEMYVTTCPACRGKGIIDFVVRHNDKPIQIAYTCDCTTDRLFKKPDKYDKQTDNLFLKMKIPFWYPENKSIPTTQKEDFQYLHELFTRRNLISLSMILHAINNQKNQRVQNVLKLAFTAALDKCSRLKPLSTKSKRDTTNRYTLSEGWVAARFYRPPQWQEVNPWRAFTNSFARVYGGKKETNTKLSGAVIGTKFEDIESGKANVLIINGSADEILRHEIPERTIDYVLTDPPFGSAIQYLTLSTFWGAWLDFEFDYKREIVVNTRQNKNKEDYFRRLRSTFQALGSVTKPGSYVHIFLNDVNGPYLHKLVNYLEEAKIVPQRILHQPPPNSFGAIARERRTEHRGHYGSYVVRGQVVEDSRVNTTTTTEKRLREKLSEAARIVLNIEHEYGGATIGTILHTAYQKLDSDEISAFAKHSAEGYLLDSIKEFAKRHNGRVKVLDAWKDKIVKRDLTDQILNAVRDAKSLLSENKDNINRVRQFVLSRFQKEGITPGNISRIEGNINQSELILYRQKRFADLLEKFGGKLGFRSVRSHDAIPLVTWNKPGSLGCNFELGEKNIKVFSLLPQLADDLVAEWGTIPYIKLERQILEWCEKNPVKASDIMKNLNPLDGPSYQSLTKQMNGSNHFHHLKLKVLSNDEVCSKHFLMRVELPKRVTSANKRLNINPGQFFHLVCDPDRNKRTYTLTLRRPFSIHGSQHMNFDRRLLAKSGEMPIEIRSILERTPSGIDFLYKVVGVGTKSLSEVKEGTFVDAIGPCGHGFRIKEEYRSAIVVAGGIGVAPLVALVERLRFLNKEVHVYFGALTKEFLKLALKRPDSDVECSFFNGDRDFYDVIRKDFEEIGAKKFKVCTDDGFLGQKGVVTELLNRDLRNRAVPMENVCIYACGPHNMLNSISKIAARYSMECQVLLEEKMACGIGACLSCVCDVRGPNGDTIKKRVCQDGPVFDSSEIIWKN